MEEGTEMGFQIAGGMALSLTTGVTSAELISGSWQNLPKGRLTVLARGSATGLTHSMLVGVYALMVDQPIMYFGTTGVLDRLAHIALDQNVNGGYLSYKIKNPTGGTLTCDYSVLFEPAGK